MKKFSKYQILGIVAGFLLPMAIAFAQVRIQLPGGATQPTVANGSYQGDLTYSGSFVDKLLRFLKDVLFALPPVLVAIAGVIFMFEVIRYIFTNKDGNVEEKGKIRSHIIWSLVALVVLLGFWGIVGLISDAFGIDQGRSVTEGDIPRVIIR
jgi:ABC-type dipeptide/oligopeptide/nickel transport system permease subunit